MGRGDGWRAWWEMLARRSVVASVVVEVLRLSSSDSLQDDSV